MFIRLVSGVGQRKKPYVLISNRTSNLRISRSNALPLSYRDFTTSYATTSICDTHPAYTFDKQCRNRLMCERTKTETTRINIVLSHFAQLKFLFERFSKFLVNSMKRDVLL